MTGHEELYSMGGIGNLVSTRIIEAVAEQRRTEPTSLPPLYGAVDPECLDRLFVSDVCTGVGIRFEYAGYEVHVDETTEVSVSAIDD